MPANALEVVDRRLTGFSASQNLDEISISGTYQLNVENTGLTPTSSVYLSINELSPVDSSVTFISDNQKEVGRIPSGETTQITIPFSTSSSASDIISVAQSACNGQSVSLKVDESISGFILGIQTDTELNIPVSVNSCSLEAEESMPEPQPPSDSDGQNGDGQEDDSGSNEFASINIDGPTEVEKNQEVTWVITGENMAEETVGGEVSEGVRIDAYLDPRNPLEPEETIEVTNDTGPYEISYTYTGDRADNVITGSDDVYVELISDTGGILDTARQPIDVHPEGSLDDSGDNGDTGDNQNQQDGEINLEGPRDLAYGVSAVWRATSPGNDLRSYDILVDFDDDSNTLRVNRGEMFMHNYSEGEYEMRIRAIDDGNVFASETFNISATQQPPEINDDIQPVNGSRHISDDGNLEARITGVGPNPIIFARDFSVRLELTNNADQPGEANIGIREHGELHYSVPSNSTRELIIDDIPAPGGFGPDLNGTPALPGESFEINIGVVGDAGTAWEGVNGMDVTHTVGVEDYDLNQHRVLINEYS